MRQVRGGQIQIKAAGERRIGGYLLRFTQAGDLDLHGEYFSKATDLNLTSFPIAGKPILVEHGGDRRFKAIPIGLFDFSSEDEIGLYVEGRLYDVRDYERMLEEQATRQGKTLNRDDARRAAELAVKAVDALLGTGKAHFSSGALPQAVETSTDGHIDRWYIIEGSVTLTPAEPDGTEIKTLRKAVMGLQGASSPAQTPAEALQTAVQPLQTKPTTIAQQMRGYEMNITEEQRQRFGAVLKEILDALSAEMELSEEEQEVAQAAMMEEMVVEAEAKVEPEGDEMDDEQKRHALRAAVQAVMQAREAKRAKARQLVKGIVAQARQAAPRTLPSGAYDDADASAKSARVTVGEERRFAHLTGSDMALTAMLMVGHVQKTFPHATLGQVLSDAYIRTMAAKLRRAADTSSSEAIKSALHPAIKANELDASTLAGQGAEWVGEFWSTEIWERARYATVYDMLVERGMMVREVPQGAQTANFPTEGSDPIAYTRPQATSTDATGRPEVTGNINYFGTGVVEVSPKEVSILTAWTDVLSEDSVIDVAAQVNRQIGLKIRETRDQLIINGDTATTANTNINIGDGTPGTGINSPYYLATDGFRKLPLVTAPAQATDAANTLSITTYRTVLSLLPGDLRQFRERLLFIIDPDTEIASLALPEIATDDVRRTAATITSGMLQNIYGIDVNVNGFVPRTAANGRVSATPANNTRGTILLVYAPYWGVAYKRQITFGTQYDLLSGTTTAVATMRIGVVARGNNAAALAYNVGSYA